MAKKGEHQLEKQIELLVNRISLLKVEEERQMNKISDAKCRAVKLIEMKRRNLELNSLKNSNYLDDEKNLKLIQKKCFHLKK